MDLAFYIVAFLSGLFCIVAEASGDGVFVKMAVKVWGIFLCVVSFIKVLQMYDVI